MISSRISLIIVLWLLHSNVGHAQVDSLLIAFEAATDEKDYTHLANRIVEKCNKDEACLKNFMAILETPPVTPKKLQGLNALALAYYRFSQHTVSIGILMRNLQYAKSIDAHQPLIGMMYSNIATQYKFLNHLDSALYYCELAESEFRLHNQVNNFWKTPYVRYLVFMEWKDYAKADVAIRQAYYLLPKDAPRADKGFLLYSILQGAHARGTPEEFEFYLDEFIRYKAKGTIDKLDARHLGLLEFFKDDAEAIAVLEQRMKLALEDTMSYSMDLTLLALAEKYTRAGKYDAAIQMLNDLNALPEPTITARKAQYQQYFEIYRASGQHQKAYDALQQYILLQDSSYHQIVNDRIAEYEVKYHLQEQERNLIEKDLQLTRSKLWQRSYFGLSGLLGISLLTGLFFHRRKLRYQQDMTAKEGELQAQRIRELEQSNKLLSLNSIIEGQEAERLRIAQDLHDGLGGLLTTVKAHFNSIQREIDQIKNINVYEKTNQLIDEACVEVRRIAHDMVPYSIKISGLSGALEDLKQSIIVRGPHCELEIHSLQEATITEQKGNMIYRIIQELTQNAVKHANATRIFIQLMHHESTLHILVEDNGKGFDINQVLANKGMGLKSIDSRVNYLGGKINFDTAPGQGTTVNIDIPLG